MLKHCFYAPIRLTYAGLEHFDRWLNAVAEVYGIWLLCLLVYVSALIVHHSPLGFIIWATLIAFRVKTFAGAQ